MRNRYGNVGSSKAEAGMKLIGLTGYAGSGKNAAADALVAMGWQAIAFADALREALLALNPLVQGVESHGGAMRLSTLVNHRGWDGAKQHDEVRRLLQRLGTEAGRDIHGQDCWRNIVLQKLKKAMWANCPGVVLTDVRFENEANLVRRWSSTARLYRVERAGVGPKNDHISEKMDFPVDGVIVNNGTLDDLHAKVKQLVS